MYSGCNKDMDRVLRGWCVGARPDQIVYLKSSVVVQTPQKSAKATYSRFCYNMCIPKNHEA